MNERIRELFDIAQGSIDPMDEQANVFEKFAELIVKECARVAAQTPCPYTDDFARQTYGHTWDMACIESAKDIRKHFGIEE